MRVCWCLILLILFLPAWGEPDPAQEKVQKYLDAVRDGNLGQAFRTLGVPARLSPSRWAILAEYQIKNPGQRQQCQSHLQTVGEALKSFNTAFARYPKSLGELIPSYLKQVPGCPAAGKAFLYERRDDHFFRLSCPHGHGHTPGLPLFSSIDGLVINPKNQLLPYFYVFKSREEDGLTRVRVIGDSSRGPMDTHFSFTPVGDLEAGELTLEMEGILRKMAEAQAPRAIKLDTASLLLGMALVSDDNLVGAAHCRLVQDGLYYRVQGARRRLGEITYAQVSKHIGKLPRCPVSGKAYQIKAMAGVETKISCPGSAHGAAGLAEGEPSRTFK